MKIVLLAGGFGTRLREETEFKPKPMVNIGEHPIIWHIMKNFATQGFNDFVVAAGYKGQVLDEYFHSLSLDCLQTEYPQIGNSNKYLTKDNWKVEIVNTGLESLTGARLLSCQPFVGHTTFLCTYGDGLSDVLVTDLLDFHNSHNGIGTITASHPISRFGVLDISEDSRVTEFREKQIESTWVNSGYFIFDPRIFNLLDGETALEDQPLEKLVREGDLYAWRHEGHWKPMDTHREKMEFDALWFQGNAFWKNWD